MEVETGVLPERYADPRRIGFGGMGAIYLAEDRELGRQVAIKVLDERFAGNEALRRRFRREALTAARLSGQPHIVTIFDVGERNGRPFIVMEYLPGGTLAERARKGRVERIQALEWLEQAAGALDAAHGQGVVHRDVKPANLLFDRRGELEVADFGIARVVDDTMGALTAAGTILGTAGYLSPEQARGETATAASDRYALAVVAYELLTGGRPFERGSATAEAAAHIHEPVPPASERGVGLPRAVDEVFERGLAKDPAHRYRTASAFTAALRTALGLRGEPTRPMAPIPAPRIARPRRGRLPLLLAALLAALLAGAVAAALTTGGSEREARRPERATLTETVVTTAPTPSPTQPSGSGGISLTEAKDLNDEAFSLMQQGNYGEALVLAERALARLQGSGDIYEAFANYNVGKSLAELGRCEEALPFLDRSEEIQGRREEIDQAREQCA